MNVRKIEKLLIEHISIRDRLRPLDQKALEAIKESLARIGLRTPITVRVNPKDDYPEPILVSGHHRLAAAKALGWDHIECFVSEDADEDRARMWEIAENLHRSDLSVLERSSHVSEWLRLSTIVATCDNSKPGPKGAVRAAARELGVDKDEAHRAVKIDSLTDEAKDAARAAGLSDNQSALLSVAKEAPERQVQRISEIAAAKAYKVAADPVSDGQANERQVARLMDAWNAAGPDARSEFMLRIDQPVFDGGAFGLRSANT